MDNKININKRAALVELASRRARTDFLSFVYLCWNQPQQFVPGKHTIAIANRLTKATNDYLNGKSTQLLISVPHRHGKTLLSTIFYSAWFLGRCKIKQPSVILTGYGAELVQGNSKKIKQLIIAIRLIKVNENWINRRLKPVAGNDVRRRSFFLMLGRRWDHTH